MQAISRTVSPDICTVNILPCQIDHVGPVKVTKRYWRPKVNPDGIRTTYFRGRRFRGRTVKLPDDYQGVVLKASKRTIVEPAPALDEDEEPDLPSPVKVVDEVSAFEQMIIWGHDQTPASDHSFVRNIDEWIAFANAVHGK